MRTSIDFVLNGQRRSLQGIPPELTVLRYLRESEGLVGTKEGCAEGDCGACTSVVAELAGEAISYRAVNTCIHFMGCLDGKALITVEGLTSNGRDLHPVQRAMVAEHASQCGFCTPGFVMSLYAGRQNHVPPHRQDIDDLLAGNLCRCTGYTPIINAAVQALSVPNLGEGVVDDDPDYLKAALKSLLQSTAHGEPLEVRSKGRLFIAPRGVLELASTLATYPEATILAGGTDLGLLVTKKQARPAVLVHIGKIEALNSVDESEQGVRIGAGVTVEDARRVLEELYPGMSEVLHRFGCVQVRNVGTVGGNIANGSPIGDLPPALIAADAHLRLRLGTQVRDIKLENYYLAYGTQDRKPSEFIESVFVPRLGPNSLLRVYKVSKRFDQDISAVCAAFNVSWDSPGREFVREVRICFGGMAGIPMRALNCEGFLRARPWSGENISLATEILRGSYEPLSDWRASAGYRTRVAGNLLQKFFLESLSGEPVSLARREYGRHHEAR